jgi:gamma-glutamylcyclotransferase (GGCT)/AIG2-like uncharacterized protein YtfP
MEAERYIPDNSLNERVFFYGTLRTGESNHPQLNAIDCIRLHAKTTIRGDVFRTHYKFPCLLEGLGLVEGELWVTNEAGIRHLDWFEGAPDFYERRKVKTACGLDAWAYFGTGVQESIVREQ